MAPIRVSATVAATPTTIWETCFAPMKWESWDCRAHVKTGARGGLGGLLKADGKVLISAVDDATSKIDYSFELKGLLGSIVAIIKKKECVEGTEGGLANMVKLSEAAQKN
eukprot:scaffold35011_cov178-Skeletonema_dohrnii-CCMP3373.AAC.1